MKYKIDNIPVKEFEIKFLATLKNGETIDLSKLLGISRFGQNLDQIVKPYVNDAYWASSKMLQNKRISECLMLLRVQLPL